MKSNSILVILLLAYLFSSRTKGIGQDTTPNITFPFLADFDELVDMLTATHPALYELTSKEDYFADDDMALKRALTLLNK